MKEEKAKNKKKLILSIAGWIAFLSVVAFLLFMVILQKFFADKAIDVVGFRSFLISNTASMEPDLQYNDLVVVKKFDFNKLEEGDFITFKSTVRINGQMQTIMITHQVYEVIENPGQARTYRTRGTSPKVNVDRALLTADGANNTNQYVGKVAFSSRFLGNLFAYIGSIPGLLMAIVNIAGAIVIIWLIKSIFKEQLSEDRRVTSANGPIVAKVLKADPKKQSAVRILKANRKKTGPLEYIIQDFEILRENEEVKRKEE